MKTISVENVKGKTVRLEEKFGSVLDAEIHVSSCDVVIYDKRNGVRHYVSLINGKVITKPIDGNYSWE